jgi:hypothetical protein
VIYGRSLDIDPEPFRVIARTGNMVGLYQIQSLVSGKIEGKWYKPYELHVLPPDKIYDDVMNPISEEYLIRKYGEKQVERFYKNLDV